MSENKFAVRARGEDLTIARLPFEAMTPDDALNLASWLVAMVYANDVIHTEASDVPQGLDSLLERFQRLVRENLET